MAKDKIIVPKDEIKGDITSRHQKMNSKPQKVKQNLDLVHRMCPQCKPKQKPQLACLANLEKVQIHEEPQDSSALEQEELEVQEANNISYVGSGRSSLKIRPLWNTRQFFLLGIRTAATTVAQQKKTTCHQLQKKVNFPIHQGTPDVHKPGIWSLFMNKG